MRGRRREDVQQVGRCLPLLLLLTHSPPVRTPQVVDAVVTTEGSFVVTLSRLGRRSSSDLVLTLVPLLLMMMMLLLLGFPPLQDVCARIRLRRRRFLLERTETIS